MGDKSFGPEDQVKFPSKNARYFSQSDLNEFNRTVKQSYKKAAKHYSKGTYIPKK